jgi:hypothetical protein
MTLSTHSERGLGTALRDGVPRPLAALSHAGHIMIEASS